METIGGNIYKNKHKRVYMFIYINRFIEKKNRNSWKKARQLDAIKGHSIKKKVLHY